MGKARPLLHHCIKTLHILLFVSFRHADKQAVIATSYGYYSSTHQVHVQNTNVLNCVHVQNAIVY